MSINNLKSLAAVIRRDREALLERWRGEIRALPSAKHLEVPVLNDHIPDLLDELASAFESMSEETIPEALLEGSPPLHGMHRYKEGFDIVEVVAEYNILRGCLYDLAENNGLSVQGKAFHILNRVFDEAIGLAVQTFAARQALEVQRRREEYLAFVAHDLRTPLNAISLAARVLEITHTRPENLNENARMLRSLHRNVQHLQSLVERVIKESENIGTEAGVRLERRRFDMWPLVEALIHDLHPVAETSATTLTNRVPEDLIAYGDASLLKRVLQNLIGNAIKYTPRGEVVIAAREIGPYGSVECEVSDNGSGIPEDRLDTIFDKLETDPDKEGGTGLGLAIVKMYVEAHGGSVGVESRPGAGSTFRFTLPGRERAN